MEKRQAAICWVMETLTCPNPRPDGYETIIRKLQSVLNEECPDWDYVFAAPNGFPEDWRGNVRRSEVDKIISEFKLESFISACI